MQKPTTISIALDVFNEKKIERLYKQIDTLLKKIKEYNKEVEKANKLLKEQENLRRTSGYVPDSKKGHGNPRPPKGGTGESKRG
jgi:predicted ribosome quality control (RQC) complex YloA/Tae2 family protein